MSTTQDLRWGGIVTDRTRSTEPTTRVRGRMWTTSGQARYAELHEDDLARLVADATAALTALRQQRPAEDRFDVLPGESGGEIPPRAAVMRLWFPATVAEDPEHLQAYVRELLANLDTYAAAQSMTIVGRRMCSLTVEAATRVGPDDFKEEDD